MSYIGSNTKIQHGFPVVQKVLTEYCRVTPKSWTIESNFEGQFIRDGLVDRQNICQIKTFF